MSLKNKKDIDEISVSLATIDTNLEELSKSNKLKDILKKHNQIKNELHELQETIDEIKQKFDSHIDIKKDIIDDVTYDKYCKDLNVDMEDIFDDISLEDQVIKYKQYIKKIMACENYLKSKKMEIIKCDENAKQELTESSENSDETN